MIGVLQGFVDKVLRPELTELEGTLQVLSDCQRSARTSRTTPSVDASSAMAQRVFVHRFDKGARTPRDWSWCPIA